MPTNQPDVIASLVGFIKANPLLAAGLAAVAGGFIRKIPEAILSLLRRNFTVSVTVSSTETAYTWMNMWVSELPYTHRARNLSVVDEAEHDRYDALHADPDKKAKVYFTPELGSHLVRIKGRLAWLSRSQDAPSGNQQKGRETIAIRMIGRDPSTVRGLVDESLEASRKIQKDLVPIMTAEYSYWSLTAVKPRRPLNSVLLTEGVMDMLVNDLDGFRTSGQWYKDKNVPYQRGYLFYGPAGVGKTSIALALASHFGCAIYALNLNESKLTDKELHKTLAAVPAGHIILLEDVDAVFRERKAGEDNNSSVTFSGLLNALDGVFSTAGRVAILTTNHIERLDPALIRPGRVDVKVAVFYPDETQIALLFKRFYEEQATEELTSKISAAFAAANITMAEAQGHFLMHRESAVGAVENIEAMLAEVVVLRETYARAHEQAKALNEESEADENPLPI